LEKPFQTIDGPNQRSRWYKTNEPTILPSKDYPSEFGNITGDIFKQSGVKLSDFSIRYVSTIRAGDKDLSIRKRNS